MRTTIVYVTILLSPVFGTYQNAAVNTLDKTQKNTQVSHQTRVRNSDNAKLTKIYFLDLKKTNHESKIQAHLTR